MLNYIFQDWTHNIELKSKLVLVLYRIGNKLYLNSRSLNMLFYIYLAFYKVITEWFFSMEIPLRCPIGKNFTLYHGYGTVINENSKLGDFVTLRHGTTIGNKGKGKENEVPKIGNHVDIGVNCVLLGNISIGNNVTIGAGSIITKDVPDNATVVGYNKIITS
jgi:putative colanic acid biosynthesis acetyltransferase WcaB